MNVFSWGAAQWDAFAESGSFLLALFGVLGGACFLILRTRFVTRTEHSQSHKALSQRIDTTETKLDGKVNKEDLKLLNDRLFQCEESLSTTKVQLAETNGLLRANTEASKSLERQITMLIENELRGERDRK